MTLFLERCRSIWWWC